MNQYLHNALKFLNDQTKLEQKVTKDAIKHSGAYALAIGLDESQIKELAEKNYKIEFFHSTIKICIDFVHRHTNQGWMYLIMARINDEKEYDDNNHTWGSGTTKLTVLEDSWHKAITKKLMGV